MMEITALLDETLRGLKDFQLATVESVMQRFNAEGNGRILVADEVGLGKTIVAKGVIAELLKAHLSKVEGTEKTRPFRVTYICSNLTLANENRGKLAVFKSEQQKKYVKEPSYSRLLEVAVKEKEDYSKGKILEVCSLTPSTSFNLTQGHGNWRERLIIYFALIQHQDLCNDKKEKKRLSNLFRDGVSNWKYEKKRFANESELGETTLKSFNASLSETLVSEVKEKCGIENECANWLDVLLAHSRDEFEFASGTHETRFRTFIRSLMARACAKHLTADLFILDEFQRFNALLNNENGNDESLVAREVFNNEKETKVLLLSATPFKALTQAYDDESGNAHAEELHYLLDFISQSDTVSLDEYEKNRQAMQHQILSLREPSFSLYSLTDKYKLAIEKILKNFICRTERSQISDGYESVFKTISSQGIEYFSGDDVSSFKAIDHLGLSLQKATNGRSRSPLMEFYKAAPWALSFLSGYQFKKQLDHYRSENSIQESLRSSKAAWLSYNKIQNYKLRMANAPHAKTRELIGKLFETASEELLWVPPSLPHFPLQGSFQGQDEFSKTLLFSSWAMVPRALSGLISYEAESRLLYKRRGVKRYYKEKKHRPKIILSKKSSISAWSMVYPSKLMIDMPLIKNGLSLEDIIHERTSKFKTHLNCLLKLEDGPVKRGDHWYALAPILLDLHDIRSGGHEYANDWLNGISNTKMDEGKKNNFERFHSYLNSDDILQLGPMPKDLASFLACLSVAGPAVAITRAWKRIWDKESEKDISFAATESAFAVIAMFNKPESEGVLKKRYQDKKNKYFRSVVRYCADGDFQAVMDEYSHLLKGAGLSLNDAKARLTEVMGIHTISVGCQYWEDNEHTDDEQEEDNEKQSLRCHYAVPLGNQKLSDEKGIQRVDKVRDAFNSPFRPFVLNSTSIGQEGLDFHWYCRRLVHWNLPGNPIDIEQREGRVNRYKSLLVRKRIAEEFNELVDKGIECDPWEQLFQIADKTSKEDGRKSDLIPFWHYPQGSAQIERFVPIMPMSRDIKRLENALKILTLYRLAFGQPRQEELMNNLLKRDFSKEEIKYIQQMLIVNLSPLRCKN